jgi:hypothetical protein
MSIEKYIAAASLGLFVMFVGEIVTIYDFMIEPPVEENTENRLIQQFEPDPKILQFISIGIAPAVILTGVSFIMAKKYGSRPIALMIIAGGVILLAGMSYAFTLVDKIKEEYVVQSVILTPPIFIGVSIPVIVVGVILLRIKKKKPKKEYF